MIVDRGRELSSTREALLGNHRDSRPSEAPEDLLAAKGVPRGRRCDVDKKGQTTPINSLESQK